MKQEDKAKAYDKVRKKIAIRFGSNVADEFFAEFEGSKDEEIRKALLEMVHDTTGDELWVDYNIHKEEAFAWLEKQGVNSVRWNENTDGNKPQKNHSVLMKTTHGIAEGEWQGEKWFQYRWSSRLKDSDVLFWIELSDIEKQGETFPVLSNSSNIGKDEQKPAEWSEEDEQRLNSCLNILQPKTFVGNMETINTKWLKSLKGRVQPQNTWKPSDEQMEALLKAVCYFGTSWVSKDHSALESLYFDLKKLREGKK